MLSPLRRVPTFRSSVPRSNSPAKERSPQQRRPGVLARVTFVSILALSGAACNNQYADRNNAISRSEELGLGSFLNQGFEPAYIGISGGRATRFDPSFLYKITDANVQCIYFDNILGRQVEFSFEPSNFLPLQLPPGVMKISSDDEGNYWIQTWTGSEGNSGRSSDYTRYFELRMIPGR